jgi:ABC-type multidrug transport system ATPase subunit
MPKVLFLDEPTSGLDASSSMELLQHLRYVAMSNRMVVLTIHQPRLEIFHMFDIILFLCQGEVNL